MRKYISAAITVIICIMAVPGPKAYEDRAESIAEKLKKRADNKKKQALILAEANKFPISGRDSEGRYFEIMALTAGPPIYYIQANRDAAITTRTDTVLEFASGGAGFSVGIWDGGHVRYTHREFQGRAIHAGDANYSTSTHATHVGGTLIAAGIDPAARGMAPEAELISYEWNNDESEVIEAAGEGLMISNHSYGFVRGWLKYGSWYWYGDVNIDQAEDYLFGFYSERSREWDEVANAAPNCLIVVSAGNDRGDGPEPGTEHLYWDSSINGWKSSSMAREIDGGDDGYDCLPDGNSIAKNLLVVGAIRDFVPDSDTTSVKMTSFSGWGPVDDGRIKPDLCGNGYALYSCSDQSDSEYIIYSGTSMASPNVCGTLATLHNYYININGGRKLRGATIKGLAIHTAREAGAAIGPDYIYGWGILDALEASRVIEEDGSGGDALIVEMTLLENSPLNLQFSGQSGETDMKITICWNDPAGEPPAPSLDNREPVLVNDLDIRVEGDAELFKPWILDPENPSLPASRGDNTVDNVEQVLVEDAGNTIFSVTISHKGTLKNGKQDFSLIASGIGGSRVVRVLADGTGDAPDIQTAVSSALPGNQVLVYPGVYNEHDILIDREILLKGVGGAEKTVIDAGEKGRCLIIDQSGSGSRAQGFTLANGYAADGRGGGVEVKGEDVSVSDCIVESSSASLGGGIYIYGSDAEILNCEVRGCDSEMGGGIYINGTGSLVQGCLVAGNTAETEGGAIFINDSGPVLENCTIADNMTQGEAGGVYISRGSTPEILKSIIAFNMSSGIYSVPFAGDLRIRCCDIYGNGRKARGDGIVEIINSKHNFSLDPVFCESDSASYGIGDSSPCSGNRSPCSERVGSEPVGCHTRSVTIVKPDGTGDTETIQEAVNDAADGDTIFLAEGIFSGRGNRDIAIRNKSVVITSTEGAASTILDCSSDQGGYNGFYITGEEAGHTVLKGITVTGAAAGAVWCEDSDPEISYCTITGNTPALGYRGGGIYLENSNLHIDHCIISDNAVESSGGGIGCNGSELTIENSTISGNTAPLSGGGINLKSGSSLELLNSTVSNNRAIAEYGGGINLVMSSVVISNCILKGNRAAESGGAVFNGVNSTVELEYSLITGNRSASMAGAIYAGTGMVITGCTITDNYAPLYGSGIECVNGQSTSIESSIIACNTGSEGLYTIIGDADISCSNIFGNPEGNYGGGGSDLTGIGGNISLDPMFCDTLNGDWRISTLSPCMPEENSCSVLIGALGPGCGSVPELGISSVEFLPAEPEAGEDCTVKLTVKNSGSDDADTVVVDIYIDPQFLPPEKEPEVITSSALQPGDSVLLETVLRREAAGRSRIYIYLDSDNFVPEADEGNNNIGPCTLDWTEEGSGIPGYAGLKNIYPNPSNADVTIEYGLRNEAAPVISIFDIKGRLVRTWRKPVLSQGSYTLVWDGRNRVGWKVAPGIYIVRFSASGVHDSRKSVILR